MATKTTHFLQVHLAWRHGRGAICSLFPEADPCVPSYDVLGSLMHVICGVVIFSCMKEHSLHYQCAAHLCTELQNVLLQLSPCGGGGVAAQLLLDC